MPDAHAASAERAALGALPEWDLSDLYPSPESPEISADLNAAEREAIAFAEDYQGKLASLDGGALGVAIEAFERLDERLSRLMSYAQLVYAADVNNAEVGRFYQTLNERVTDISTHLLFFRLELNRIDDADLNKRLAAPKLATYRPWLDDVRAFKPHELSDEAERLLHEKHVAGRAAWVRLFDETAAALRFTVDGEPLTMAEVLSRLMDHDPARREAAAHAVADELKNNIRLFSLITNTLAKDKEIEDQWRRYARPVSARNLSNQVEDEVVDALVAAVTSAYPRLSHRYYQLKAKWFGTDQLNYWDRNAPLPQGPDHTVAWGEAVDTVLTAYAGFSDELAAVGRRFFDNAWIDAPARPGKASGAFAHPTVPSAHPYLLLNYQGKTRDVMTLAHELGHGVHQVLAGDQGHLLCRTPLTLAETASVFGEMLTFQAMLAAETDPARRKAMLAQKVEDMLNTVVRQISFYEFERRLHDARRAGELLPDQIGEIWMEISRESLGPGVRLDPEYAVYWAYVPHFIHSPFYVYAYAFGDCLVNSLYAVYQQAEAGFAEKYLDLLRAGGSKRHKALLAPFGLDASDPAFWDKGLDVIGSFLDELEAME